MRHLWPVAALLVVAAVLAAGYVLIRSNAEVSGPHPSGCAPTGSSCGSNSVKAAASPEQRIKKVKEYAALNTSRSSDAFFNENMNDDDSGVRVAAFEGAFELSRKEGASASVEVVRKGLGRPHRDVQRKALVSAREVKAPSLVQELLDCFDRGGTERFLALDALAVTDDSRAIDKVCGLAIDQKAERSLRIRAVALLAQVQDRKAIGILRDLVTGNDPELARVAQAALEARQQESPK